VLLKFIAVRSFNRFRLKKVREYYISELGRLVLIKLSDDDRFGLIVASGAQQWLK
jgi:hypothetical protein